MSVFIQRLITSEIVWCWNIRNVKLKTFLSASKMCLYFLMFITAVCFLFLFPIFRKKIKSCWWYRKSMWFFSLSPFLIWRLSVQLKTLQIFTFTRDCFFLSVWYRWPLGWFSRNSVCLPWCTSKEQQGAPWHHETDARTCAVLLEWRSYVGSDGFSNFPDHRAGSRRLFCRCVQRCKSGTVWHTRRGFWEGADVRCTSKCLRHFHWLAW